MTTLSFNIKALDVNLPTLRSLAEFCALPTLPPYDPKAKLPKAQDLPMMTARRLTVGARLAADLSVRMSKQYQPQAAVFASRHGELERNYHMLQALAQGTDVSPTDFAMSVHNAACGIAAIVAQQNIPISAVAAQENTLWAGLVESASLLSAGYQTVLLVCFDGKIPDFYAPLLPPEAIDYPFAVGLVLTAGSNVQVRLEPSLAKRALDKLPALEVARFLAGSDRELVVQLAGAQLICCKDS